MRSIINAKLGLYVPSNDPAYKDIKDLVLHVLSPREGGGLSGADTHVIDLCKEQKKNGVITPMVLFKRGDSFSEILENNKIAYVNAVNVEADGEVAYCLRDFPAEYNLRIIHSHQFGANFLASALKQSSIKEWRNLPTVMTCHGWGEESKIKRIRGRKDTRTYYQTVIAMNEKDHIRLSERYSSDIKVHLIPDGVDHTANMFTKEDVKEFKDRFQIPHSKRIICYVGRLASEKRIDTFIRVANKIIFNRDDVHFIIAGIGEDYKNLRELANSFRIEEHVTFAGLVYPPTIVYHISDFMMLTSENEKTPRSVLECMASKKPVIATDVDRLSEIIDSNVNGVLVADRDITMLAREANSLLDRRVMLETMGKNAYNKIVPHHTIKKMCDSINKVYRKLIT
jgi:glycosyltransferase involved in cell wall biosynthesis